MSNIQLQQSQQLRLSSQQIITSQLLQLPLLHLEQRIYDELENNPMLELEEKKSESVDDSGAHSDGGESGDMFGSIDRFENDKASVEGKEKLQKDDAEALPQFAVASRPTETYIQAMQHDSCEERLLKELSVQSDIGARELVVAAEILGNLNDDGYLDDNLSIVVEGLQKRDIEVDEKEVEAVRQKIYSLDPAGIAARNLQERLLVQLDVKAGKKQAASESLASRILRNHYDDFLNNRYQRILDKMHIRPAQMESAVAVIGTLDPHPFISGAGNDEYIVPDFIVTYEDGRLTAVLNDRSNLSVQVSGNYDDVLKGKGVSAKDKKFMRGKLHRAREFTNAIAQRRNTLLKVAEALMNFQYDFFVAGPEKLAPLVMNDVAEKTGLDLSTISRAVNGKYVQTRFGVFELKYFFSGSLQTEKGEDMSTKVIKQYIRELIEGEAASRPLNDDKLAKMLEEKGIKIARRTVAKYREQMQIPVARLRKKIF